MPRRSERGKEKEPVTPKRNNASSSKQPTAKEPVTEETPVTPDTSELEEKMRKLVLESLQDSIPTLISMIEKSPGSRTLEKNPENVVVNIEDEQLRSRSCDYKTFMACKGGN